MKSKKINKNVIIILLGAIIGYLLFTSLVNSRFADIESSLQTQLAEQESTLTAIAVTTARNGADGVTERVVRDCAVAERTNFDELLSQLNDGLTRTELVELERLFGRCGSYYSELKSVMVARLARETQIYERLVENLEVVTDDNVRDEYVVETWQALVTQEEAQSVAFARLVQLQDQIITELLAGSAPDSDEIVLILQEVREVQEALLFANKQAGTLREQLISL